MRLPLNAFLLREGIAPIRAISRSSLPSASFWIWDNDGLSTLDPADEGLLGAALPGDVIVVTLQSPGRLPAWQRFVREALDLPDYGSPSSSLGVIICCGTAIASRETSPTGWLAWCFGTGSRALRRAATDPRFGLMVALNTLVGAPEPPLASGIDQTRLRSGVPLRHLQYRTTTPYVQQTGHRAARGIPLQGFRIDRQSDLLSAAGGRSADPSFPDVLGGRSVRFRAEVEVVGDLIKLSDRLVARAGEGKYRDQFAWVDNITPVYDESLLEILRAQLVKQILTQPTPATVDVILPDDLLDVDDERSIQYILFPRERQANASRITLTVAMIANMVSGTDEPEAGLDAELRFLDASHHLIGSQTVIECLSADLQIDDEHFIAYDGDFYRVDPTFVAGIDEEVCLLPASTIDLPCYPGGAEHAYNRGVASSRSTQFVLLDRELIHLSGQAGVESCDLISAAGTLIHVKRKGKSAVLSHLFLQATNSCEVLRRSGEARDQLRNMVDRIAATADLREGINSALARLDAGHWNLEVSFAFLGDWKDRTLVSLPLFSRLSLAQASRRIQQLGYSPSVTLVDICR